MVCSGLASSQEDVESSAPKFPEIVKQVNEINEDGSYTVGYEASDGSFKIETRDTEGNVEGIIDKKTNISVLFCSEFRKKTIFQKLKKTGDPSQKAKRQFGSYLFFQFLKDCFF